MSRRDMVELLYPGRGGEERQFEGPQEGVIAKVQGNRVWFTLPDFDSQQLFGPATLPRQVVEPASSGADAPHTHTVEKPKKGDRCLVLFADGGIGNPWVIAWA